MTPAALEVSASTGASEEELRRWYHAYRRRQARRLVSILPRDAVRPLYRAALAGMDARSAGGADPLRVLMEYCATVLPLPPFEVWLADLARYPAAHFQDWDEAVDAPSPADPATLAARELIRGDERWRVTLCAYPQDGAWRAHLSFAGPALHDAHRTAPVFREPSAEALRDRFMDFEITSIEAFLRSCLA